MATQTLTPTQTPTQTPSDLDGDGFTVVDGDCDDDDAAVHPDADEVCDDIDNDCDDTVDEDDAVDASTWYRDLDGDAYGDADHSQVQCDAPELYIPISGDCDDDDPEVHPGEYDACDGIDNDCDGVVDGLDELIGTEALCAAESCQDLLDQYSEAETGVYWIDPDGDDAFETLCEMDTDGGGWTLIMTLVDDERLLSNDVASNMWQYTGENRWADTSTFGDLYTSTTAQIGDYKNRAYWSLSASNVLMAHTPNGTEIEDTIDVARYVYHSDTDFLESHGGSLYSLYNDYYPLLTLGSGTPTTGLAVDVVYAKGTATELWEEQYPNNQSESHPGQVTFSGRNSEGYPFAMCPVDYYADNREHGCVGGNGTTGGRGAGGWGNLREWHYGHEWGQSTYMMTATWMVFVR